MKNEGEKKREKETRKTYFSKRAQLLTSEVRIFFVCNAENVKQSKLRQRTENDDVFTRRLSDYFHSLSYIFIGKDPIEIDRTLFKFDDVFVGVKETNY